MPSRLVPEDVAVHAPELPEIPAEALAQSLKQARKQILRRVRVREHPRHQELRVKALLRVPARRDVRDEAEGQEALLALDEAQADLHGKLGSVLAASGELETVSHGSHPGVAEEAAAVVRVSDPESLGQERLERLTVDLLPLVAEHLCETSVGPHDPSSAVHHHDSQGGRFENGVGQGRTAAEGGDGGPLRSRSRFPGDPAL